MNESKRSEKASLPFYELPPNIKPCSQIIQETRLQLKYSAKIGSDIDPAISAMRHRTPSGDHAYDTRHLNSHPNNYELDLRSSTTCGELSGQSVGIGPSPAKGVHVVHTKRPFTPRDSINLWGMSARKRPPSAIT